MTFLPWVSVVVSLTSVAVALLALRTHGKRELRGFNRKLLTEQVIELLTLLDAEFARLGAGSAKKDGFDVGGVHYMELSYQILSHKTAIDVVSPSCARAVTESLDRMSKFRDETDGKPYPLLGAMFNGLALMRGQLLVAHWRAVAYPQFDEKEIRQRAAKLKEPIDGTELKPIVGPGT